MLSLAATVAGGAGFFFQQIELGITYGAMFALVALGYTLVYGIIELINFAHGDVFMWSTVVMLLVAQRLGFSQTLGGFALIGALLFFLVIAMLTSALLNVAIERVAYRRLRRAPRLAPLIAAVGVSFILENVAQLTIGSGFIAFPAIFPATFISLGAVKVYSLHIVIILLAVGLMYALDRFIQTTKLGKAMRATAQDPETAALMGVNVNRTIFTAFLIGGALAGAAGLCYNLVVTQVNFFVGFKFGLIAFTAAVFGGIGNVYGAVAGGFIIGVIYALVIPYFNALPGGGNAWVDAVVFVILILTLVFRPSGLLGQQVPDKA